ncbi:MAG: caspase family protein [Deltaproteobacteria bacterium]|nr:caspase family protein [Deltaproteobacteria bacterium]
MKSKSFFKKTFSIPSRSIAAVFFSAFVVFSLGFPQVSFAALASDEASVDEQQSKIAIIIANNRGLPHEGELRFAESDGRRMAKVLLDLGGYPSENVHMLLGKTAAEIQVFLDELRLKMKTDSAQGSSSTPVVILYFSGHSDGKALHVNGTLLPTNKVHHFLDSFNSGVRIALIDACKSGSMIRSKGMSPGASFDIRVQEDPEVDGKIVITSSGEDEVAQESDVLQGSFFTHFFVTGLYGQADKNSDGRVTLEEAYRFAHYNTVQKTIAASGGVQHPSYLFAVEGEGDIVLSTLSRATARLFVTQKSEGFAEGRYFVLDADNQLVLSEFLLDGDKRATVHLPPGAYQVRKREDARLLETEIVLGDGEVRSVSDDEMHEVQWQSTQTTKGGVVAQLKTQQVLPAYFPQDVQVRLGLGVRQGFIPEMDPATELQLATRFSWRYAFLEPRLTFRGAEYGSAKVRFFHSQMDLGLAAGPRYRLGDVEFSGGAAASMVLMGDQKSIGGLNLGIDGVNNGVFSGALLTRGFVEVGFFINDALSVHLAANTDFFFFRAEDTVTSALETPVVGAQAAFAWTF